MEGKDALNRSAAQRTFFSPGFVVVRLASHDLKATDGFCVPRFCLLLLLFRAASSRCKAAMRWASCFHRRGGFRGDRKVRVRTSSTDPTLRVGVPSARSALLGWGFARST